MLNGLIPAVHGDGLQSRDFTFFVENAVQAVVKAADARDAVGKVYNIGNGCNNTLLDLIRCLNELLGTDMQPTHESPRQGDVRHSQADISRARKDLGYEPTVSFVEGVRRTLESHRAGRRQAAHEAA